MSTSFKRDPLASLRAGEFAGARRLDLSCGLEYFPQEIYDLADTLEILNLSGNHLSSLPLDLARLEKLKVIFCSGNQFTQVPEVLGQCSELTMVGFKSNKINLLGGDALPRKLQWLILTDNQLDVLPSDLGRCQQLQKLMLAGNKLTHLPDTMAACARLELLRISANRFESLPEWLLTLPRLAWLAFAGNPMCSAIEASHNVNQVMLKVDWAELKLQQKIGEGASGVIYQTKWQGAEIDTQTVALKLFKGAMTSDGLPQSEMAACIAAGSHPHLTSMIGLLKEHPDNVSGLVMPLIKPAFSNLAHPPSLASCTRDVYANNAQFTLNHVLAIALGIASAMQHLHASGLMHGDCYAHNILHHSEEYACLLSDFGAASFMPVEHSKALQNIEARAFGCLLEELIDRCLVNHESEFQRIALRKLQCDCLQAEVAQRPEFNQMIQALSSIQAQAI